MAFLAARLRQLLNTIEPHIGVDQEERREPILADLISSLGSLDMTNGLNGTSTKQTQFAEHPGPKTTNWSRILTGTLDFLASNVGIVADLESQAVRVHDDFGILIDIAYTKAQANGLDDKTYLMERVIQVAASLPNGSKLQEKLTGLFIKGLWDTLDHPPLTYLGDENEYRTADGSNNNYLNPKLGMAGTPYARTVTSMTTDRIYPDPYELFDKLLARAAAPTSPKEHPNRISSMLFYMATIIIHDIFRTGDDTENNPNPNYNISSTSSYLDLSPLYGNNTQEQEAVRTMNDGLLKPDTFHEHRLLGFPPGVCAYLICFNRFHNYVAKELKRINEFGKFSLNPRYGKDAEKRLDHDLFNVARLITCGLYVNIILGDYVQTILNMNHAPNSDWSLDPRKAYPANATSKTFPLGTGNQCSVEFNLVYRWHAAVSAKDEKWTEEAFGKLFPGRDVSRLSLGEFLQGLAAWRDGVMKQKPETRTFGGLERKEDGSFDSTALAKLIAEGTNDCAAAFGARQNPVILKLIDVLGIKQARGWQVATLNELRKFLDLAPHKTFEEINPDPEIVDALRSLYKEPDYVEMYPGLVLEDAKRPVYPGSGLCAGFTITRAVLSDAVALTRGDRFYTLGWSPTVMTSWGFKLIQSDGQRDKLARGGKLHQLLDVAFPGFYKENSAWKMFPFTTPDEIERIFRKQGLADKYDFSSPL